MNRPAALALAVAALAAFAVSAGAKAVRYRDVRAEYTTAGGVTGVIKGQTRVNDDRYGAVSVPTRRGDVALDLTIVDSAGVPAAAELAQDLDGDGRAETGLGRVCGASSSPLRLRRAGVPVEVFVVAGPCGDDVSTPTSGTVRARLHTTR